jgi:hypothetical protein
MFHISEMKYNRPLVLLKYFKYSEYWNINWVLDKKRLS